MFWTKLCLGMTGVALLAPFPVPTTLTLVEFGTQSLTALAIVSLYAQYIVESSDRPNLKYALLNLSVLWMSVCIFTHIADFSGDNIKEILCISINSVLVLLAGIVAAKTSTNSCLAPCLQ